MAHLPEADFGGIYLGPQSPEWRMECLKLDRCAGCIRETTF
jgi:hypothetical protein